MYFKKFSVVFTQPNMAVCTALLAIGIASATADRALSMELLADPGFEASVDSTTNPSWSLTGTGSGAIQFWDLAAAANHTPGGEWGIWFKSFNGAAGAIDGSVQQTVGVTPGTGYDLSAFFKVEANFTAADLTLSMTFLNAALTPILSVSLDVLGSIAKDNNWYQYSVAAFAPLGATSAVIGASMNDGVLSQLNPQSAFVDDFSLMARPVPAPGMLYLFGIGIAGLAIVARRRNER